MSNGPEFFRTGMGRTFYEGTMPRIAAALEKIAERLPAPEGKAAGNLADAIRVILADANLNTTGTIVAIEKLLEGLQ